MKNCEVNEKISDGNHLPCTILLSPLEVSAGNSGRVPSTAILNSVSKYTEGVACIQNDAIDYDMTIFNSVNLCDPGVECKWLAVLGHVTGTLPLQYKSVFQSSNLMG